MALPPKSSAPEMLKFTYADYLALPDDGKRYEIIAGDLLMSPSPNRIHQYILLKLAKRLDDFVEKQRLGHTFIAPFDVVLSKHNVVQPDIVFVSQKNEHIISETHIHGTPDLLVEIISPGSARRDREIKRKLYAKFGVSEYWLVNPKLQTIEVYRLQNQILRRVGILKNDEVVSSPLLPGFALPVHRIFPS